MAAHQIDGVKAVVQHHPIGTLFAEEALQRQCRARSGCELHTVLRPFFFGELERHLLSPNEELVQREPPDRQSVERGGGGIATIPLRDDVTDTLFVAGGQPFAEVGRAERKAFADEPGMGAAVIAHHGPLFRRRAERHAGGAHRHAMLALPVAGDVDDLVPGLRERLGDQGLREGMDPDGRVRREDEDLHAAAGRASSQSSHVFRLTSCQKNIMWFSRGRARETISSCSASRRSTSSMR